MSRRKRGGRQRPGLNLTSVPADEIVVPRPSEDQMRLELKEDDAPSGLSVEIVREPDAAAPTASTALDVSRAPVRVAHHAAGVGARLRAAREAAELSADDVARRLRVPLAVVRGLEAEQFEQLGPPVYTRGYLKSYARMVGVPEAALESAFERLVEPPQLIATHTVAPGRYLATRFTTPLLYALLTLFVVVPALSFVYQRAQLTDRMPKLERLDAEVPVEIAPQAETVASEATPPTATPAGTPEPAPVAPPPQPVAASTPDPVEADAQQPVMASLAPMATAASPQPARLGAQRVALKLAESSWVELVGADGGRIEYAMLPAGTTREYQIAGKAMLRIGNIRGARLEVDGRQVDLQPFARANVARVTLGDGPVAPATTR